MQPIEINVKVTIGMENALLGLISKFTDNREAAPAAAPATKPRKQAKAVEEKPQPQPEVENKPEPSAEPAEPQPEASAEPAPAEQLAQDKEYTEVDVRAAMERTRKRIEGEDYKENTSSEKYKKYHRQLTAEFKNIAAFLGSEKPSALPTSELRRNFCNQCDELILEDGKITRKVPF